MRVQWERTGGFAGMRMAGALNTDSLAPDEARELRELVDAAGFFDLPEVLADSADEQAADRFSYTLTIQMEGRSHTVRTSEAAAPAKLRPLIRWLAQAARKGRARP